MTVYMRSVVALEATNHWRKVGGEFRRDHVALLEDGRRVVIALAEASK
jgi:hypothetical protein